MTKEIPLTKGAVALVDDDMYDYLMQWKWHLGSQGYAVRNCKRTEVGRKKISMHTMIIKPVFNMVFDHASGNKLDNTRKNLRLCTKAQNSYNKHSQRNNKSGFRGVYWHKNNKGWQAQIRVNYKNIYIGTYHDAELAARAYDAEARKHFGKYARTNFT